MCSSKAKNEIDLDTFNLIRFGNKSPGPKQQPLMNLSAIAGFYGVPYSNIIKLHR